MPAKESLTMRFGSSLAAFLRNLFQRQRIERELAEEVDSYLALSADRKMRDGLDPAAARRDAATEFGGVEQVKEEVRDVRFGHFLETRLQDLRFAFRTLRKAPVFSVTVVSVLALGIGSTALMFTLVNSILIQGPPFPEASRLFMLWGKIPEESQISFSPSEFTAWQKQTVSFESLAAFTGNGFTLYDRGEPELVTGQLVTPSLFAALRTPPALGRAFSNSEAQRGSDHVAILSDTLWREKFGARADVLGQSVNLDGESYTIVGVMPRGFHFPTPQVKLWAPIAFAAPFFREHPDAHLLRVLGRLKPSVTPAQLNAETVLIGRRVLDPADKSGRLFYGVSLQDQTSGELRAPLLVLLTAVGLLLAMACANVANLMLARGKARASEFAVRAALGASRRRLIGQLLTESAVLAAMGGAVGIALAIWSLELLRHFATQNIPQLLQARVDSAAALFVIVASILCGMLVGVGPAFRASATSFGAAFGSTTRSTAGASATRSRNLLVFAEVALAAILLIGCALMLRSFVRLSATDPGFTAANAVTANTIVSEQRYPKATQMLMFYRDARAKISALPGVSAAGVVTHLPFAGNDWGNSIEIAGRPAASQSESASIRGTSPGYFSAIGLPLGRGRDFTERDDAQAVGVAIVSEQFARRYWPNENPLGRQVRYDRAWLTVIGVCGDVKHNRLDETPNGTIYVAYPQMAPAVLELVGRDLHFVVRSSRPASAAGDLRTALQSLDPQLVVKVDAMDSLVSESLAQPRFRTWLIAIFSIFALSLAALGIYGVIAYLVTQRYKEIGIRLALGATRRNILGLILGGTLRLAAAGTIVGLGAAFFLARFLTAILFGITPHDAPTFIAVPLGLIAIALLAAFLPAFRATRIDPVRSLRYE
ncbi:MAG: ABC transporter permease [Verrucomicrobiota bacterium]|nr:ABC transporter permease [Verrucomicrobiota bacterium]